MFCTFSFQKNPIYFFISFTTDKIAICLGFYSSSEQHLYWRLVELKELEVFSKFYGKVGVIFWFLFHLISKNYVLYWDFDFKSWIVDFFTSFTQEKTPQNNFSSQNFSVENNYFLFYPPMMPFCVLIKTNLINFCSNTFEFFSMMYL